MDLNNFEVYYNNIKKIRQLQTASLLGVCGTSLITTATGSNPLFILPFWVIAGILKGVIYKEADNFITCNEYEALRKSYAYVLEHIVELSKTINFTSVEEVYILIEYLFFRNYLSYNQNDTDPKENLLGLPRERSIQAELSLNNHGVCRNKAYTLANVYNGLGIEAGILPGIHVSTTFELDPSQNPVLMELLAQDPNEEVVLQIINEVMKTAYPNINNFDKYIKSQIKKNKDGNHVITIVSHDNKSYYLDPTLHHVYYETAEDPNKLTERDGSYFITSKRINKAYRKKLVGYQERKFAGADYHEIMKNIGEAGIKVLDYDETFDSFHKNINPALEEAENAYQSIRKSIK